MVEAEGGWSSEEEELNFGGTMGVAGIAAIRSATFVENQQQNTNTYAQKVRSLHVCHRSKLSYRKYQPNNHFSSDVLCFYYNLIVGKQ